MFEFSPAQVASIVAVVVGFTELIKLSKVVPDKYGLGIAALISFFGIIAYAYSQPEFVIARTMIWGFVASYLLVITSAAGVYGIVRESRGGDVTNASRTGFDGQREPMDSTLGSNTTQRDQSRGNLKMIALLLMPALLITGCAAKDGPDLSPERRVALYGTQVAGYLKEVKTSADNLYAKQLLPEPAYRRTLEALLKVNEAGVQLADALAAYDAATSVAEQDTIVKRIDAALAALQVLLPQVIPMDVSVEVRTRLNQGITEVQRLIITIMRFTAPQGSGLHWEVDPKHGLMLKAA